MKVVYHRGKISHREKTLWFKIQTALYIRYNVSYGVS